MSLFTAPSGAEIYAGLVATRLYVGDMLGAGAAAFVALDDPGAYKVLVSVTRYIDRFRWKGVADAFGGTTLQFPRTGIVDAAGVTVTDVQQLAIVAHAVGELCALAAADDSVLTAVDTGNNLRVAAAGGGVEVEYFNPTSVRLGTATTLPQAAQQLLGAWLSSASAATGGSGSSGGCESDFARDRTFTRTLPY